MSTYTWKIEPSLVRSMKNASNGAVWTSPVFSSCGFRWYLEVQPNHSDAKGHVQIFLYLVFLPPKVKSILIRREIRLTETGTSYTSNKAYDKDNMNWGSWPFRTLKIAQIQNVTTLTFSAKIDIGGVIDIEDNDITNQYMNTHNEESKHSPLESVKQSDQKLMEARLDSLINSMDKLVNNFQSLEQRMSDVEQRINEEQKDNTNEKVDKLTEEMRVMQRDLQKLSTIPKMNPKQLELKSWLQNEVGFVQYYVTFMENGIEDLSIASMLTMETIKSMGIDKIGHQMKILRAVT
eukprot:46881_1